MKMEKRFLLIVGAGLSTILTAGLLYSSERTKAATRPLDAVEAVQFQYPDR